MNASVVKNGKTVSDPPFSKFLFGNVNMSWLWLVVRVWLGYQWIDAALHKVSEPAWVVTGDALKGYWSRIVVIPAEGRPLIAFDWYRAFIQTMLDAEAYTWFAKVVAYGELLVGAALILGAFTGIAALFGAVLNWNFMMAGSASTNPVLLIAAIGLILAWKIAGRIGLDYFLLPWIGTPWNRATATAEAIGERSAVPTT